ncbi:MAG: cob(I)yrinic acid a,c-diamide adenosyltransferase [Planctomycetota bacterium]|nr:MAG: cob(I)yrinic acid a,c-diamide adenosyltransferase [Planctomycetota bacterium]
MKIYTRCGDHGETGLFGGGRVGKGSLRIDAYGQVDELNSVLGWCAVAADGDTGERILAEQARLFVLGSWLATPAAAPAAARDRLPAWDEDALGRLEAEIDRWQAELPELHSFVLPGGAEAAARLHLARAVCRRAERALAALADEEAVDPRHQAYLNRLGDWLFVLARRVNHLAGVAELPWTP